MTQNIQVEILKYFPNMKEVAIPKDCAFLIDYAKKQCFEGPEGRIFFQEYDAKDTLHNLMEFDLKEDIHLPFKVIFADLFWLYLLKGAISILDENGNPFPGDWLHTLTEREYVVLFSSPRKYKIVLNKGYHLLLYFSPARKWLKRHSEIDGKELQEITQYLYGNQNTYYGSKILKFDPAIDRLLLVLFGFKKVKGLTMDSRVYDPITELITISRNDIEGEIEKHIHSTKAIRIAYEAHKCFTKAFDKDGTVLTLAKIREHFEIPESVFRSAFTYIFKVTFQTFQMDYRLNEGQRQVIETDEQIRNIAYNVGFNLESNFTKQYKKKFGLPPIEDRKNNRRKG